MEFQAFLLEFLAFWVEKFGFSKQFFLDQGQKFQRELIVKGGEELVYSKVGQFGNLGYFL